MNSKLITGIARIVAALIALACIVTVYRRWLHVNPTTVALTFLLLVLLMASKWGLRYAVGTSIVAAVCFNFFFLPPLGTFTVADPQNWIALLAFLVTAVVSSRLSDRIQTETAQARSRQHEMELLYRLSRELLQLENVTGLLNAIPQVIADLTLASGVVLYLDASPNEYLSAGPDSATLAKADLRSLMHLSEIDIARFGPAGGERAAIPLRVGVRPRGVLLIAGTSISHATLEALGGLVSISIDRADALERATRSEANKESDRLRTAMLDSITHELRTPLTAIKASATTMLLSKQLDDEQRQDLLSVIDEESDRLDRLIGEAVQMQQLDSREIQMHRSPQSVAGLIANATETSASTLAQHSIRVALPENLPFVLADAVWIEKVLCNLLENAAKYSPDGSEIFISALTRADMVEISVADHGVGIDPFDQQLIFNKFYRVRGQHVSGTGMGLAICKAILEENQGSIDVTSQPGKGSVFNFTLPAAQTTAT